MALPSPQVVQDLAAALADVAGSYTDSADPQGYMSRVQIISKAKDLVRTLLTPDQASNYHGLNMAELIAIRTFIKLKVLDAIPKEGAISLEDLSQTTGVQDSLLERLGRILVATGFLDQSGPNGGDYLHTKFSLSYLLNKPGPGHFFLAMYDEWFKNMVDFDDYLVAKGQIANAREPDEALHNPYTAKHNQEGTPVWTIMAQNPERIQAFQTGLAGFDAFTPVVGQFDFDRLKNSPEDDANGVVELVDVGGGYGVVLKQILAQHPALSPKSCVLQERPDVIQMARASGVLPADVQYIEHNFMTEQPVKGAKAYFMRWILHDYSDAVGIEILTQLARSMSPHSRVLICEVIMPPRVGEADFTVAVLDQAVMSMGGKERTEAGLRRMLEAAGIEVVQVWRTPGVPGGCIEGRLKR